MRVQFHLLSFEGPDGYARAGGIASRVTGLAQALAEVGFATHLWFVGDPDLPGHEAHDQFQLHRWCQWLSRAYPAGVYDGEDAKQPDSRRVLLRASDAVLAHSRHEPFGLVGLETMAVGGSACTGCSGEDSAVPGRNALVLETADPDEFLGLCGELRANPALAQAIRRAGRLTAQHYRWREIVARILLPRRRFVATRVSAEHGSPPEPLAPLESLGLEATSQRKWQGLSGIRDPPREARQRLPRALCAPVIGGSRSRLWSRHPQRSLAAKEEHTACICVSR
jgi:hypothetical protein